MQIVSPTTDTPTSIDGTSIRAAPERSIRILVQRRWQRLHVSADGASSAPHDCPNFRHPRHWKHVYWFSTKSITPIGHSQMFLDERMPIQDREGRKALDLVVNPSTGLVHIDIIDQIYFLGRNHDQTGRLAAQ